MNRALRREYGWNTWCQAFELGKPLNYFSTVESDLRLNLVTIILIEDVNNAIKETMANTIMKSVILKAIGYGLEPGIPDSVINPNFCCDRAIRKPISIPVKHPIRAIIMP